MKRLRQVGLVCLILLLMPGLGWSKDLVPEFALALREGNIDKAHEVFCVKIPAKADIVVTVAPYPMDVDLYQSQKAIDNGKLALKEGGILIMAASCRTGIGPKDFFDLMASCGSLKETMEKIDKGYRLGYHKAAKLAEIGLWAEIWGVTDLPDEDMEKVFIKSDEVVIQLTEYEIGPGNYVVQGYTRPYKAISVKKDGEWERNIRFVLEREGEGIIGETIHYVP